MHAIIIHGMGRTPLSMCLLAVRLRAAGIKSSLFAYTVAFESWASCTSRLHQFIARKADDEEFIVIAHSLGTVLSRAVLPTITHKPVACFFLAPPTKACDVARRLASNFWYRWFAGEMGQLLANQQFMESLPVPDVSTKIYAGDAGLTGRYSPFGNAPNDGILTVNETLLPDVPHQVVPSWHTFIMNNRLITKDIIKIVESRKYPS